MSICYKYTPRIFFFGQEKHPWNHGDIGNERDTNEYCSA